MVGPPTRINPRVNGVVDTETATEAQAAAFFESLEAVNLDEITTTTVRVAIIEFRQVPAKDAEGNLIIEHGEQKLRRESYTRVAEIENYVPMAVFNRMMATRSAMLRKRQRFLSANSEEEMADPIIDWMVEQVLSVWKISEPDITKERLENGMPFDHLSRLFTLFFGHLLRVTAK